jgi:hypothetical protein
VIALPAAAHALLFASVMRAPVAVALASLLSLPVVATAQPGVAPVYVPPPPTAPVAAEPTTELVGIARRQKEDPASDRAYLARTALVAPSGTVTLQARAPIAPGMLGGLSASLGRVEIGVGSMLIFEEGAALGFNAKVQLLKGRRSALAVTLDTLTPPDDDETLYYSSLVASFCADGDACNTLLSAHLSMFAFDGEDEAPVFAGLSFSKGAKTRLVSELHITDNENESVFAGYLGGRWGGQKVAFDAGIAVAGVIDDAGDCGDCYEDDPEVIPYPFIGLSARM